MKRLSKAVFGAKLMVCVLACLYTSVGVASAQPFTTWDIVANSDAFPCNQSNCVVNLVQGGTLHFEIPGYSMFLTHPGTNGGPGFSLCADKASGECGLGVPNANDNNPNPTGISFPSTIPAYGTYTHPDGPTATINYTWVATDPTNTPVFWYKGTLTITGHWHTRFFRTGAAYYFVIESGQLVITDESTVASQETDARLS
jgi:hypothetical protein